MRYLCPGKKFGLVELGMPASRSGERGGRGAVLFGAAEQGIGSGDG